jgi:hypothetical protein
MYNFNCNKINNLLTIVIFQKDLRKRLNFIFSFFTDLNYLSMHSVNEFSNFIRNQTLQFEKSNNMKIATEKTKNTTNQLKSVDRNEHAKLQELLKNEQNQDQKNDSDMSIYFSVIKMSDNQCKINV